MNSLMAMADDLLTPSRILRTKLSWGELPNQYPRRRESHGQGSGSPVHHRVVPAGGARDRVGDDRLVAALPGRRHGGRGGGGKATGPDPRRDPAGGLAGPPRAGAPGGAGPA